MKKLALLTAVVSATLAVTACSDPQPTRVVHETRVVHTHRSSDQVNVPSNNGPDNFEAVERPSTYSH